MGVNRNIALPEEKGPDIVYTGRMVCMFVGKEDPIEPGNPVCQHLLPEIRATINYIVVFIPGNQNGDAKPFISGVRALADRMVTPNYRDSLRCASSQKSYFQPLIRLIQIYNLFI